MLSAKHDNKKKGRFAEFHAMAFLQRKGCTILAKNYRYLNGELDIVAKDSQGTILFVEVKSVWTADKGSPASRITPQKQFRIWKTAAHFLHHHGGQNQKSRFDVICMDRSEGKAEIRYYTDAFIACRVIPEC